MVGPRKLEAITKCKDSLGGASAGKRMAKLQGRVWSDVRHQPPKPEVGCEMAKIANVFLLCVNLLLSFRIIRGKQG